jgi:hypothetical protein
MRTVGGFLCSALVLGAQGIAGEAALPAELGPDRNLIWSPPGSLAILELYGTGIRFRPSLEAVTCNIGGEYAPSLPRREVVW